MTREEAIKVINKHFPSTSCGLYTELIEALHMAIEALQDKTDSDLISRADAIKAIESRQTEQWIDADVDYNNGLESAVAEIKALPSADRPSGEWVRKTDDLSYWYVCSQCGERPMCNRFSYKEERSDYCPNCGAKMGGNK